MRRNFLAWVFRAVAVAATLALGWYFCVCPAQANRAVLTAFRTTDALAQQTQLSRNEVTAARNVATLERFTACCPTDVNLLMLIAGNERMAGHFDRASAIYTQAIAIEPRPEIYFARGLVGVDMRDTQRAQQDFVTAARFNVYFLDELEGQLRQNVADAISR